MSAITSLTLTGPLFLVSSRKATTPSWP